MEKFTEFKYGQPYRVTAERQLNGSVYAKEGDIVYLCAKYDYGLAMNDGYATNSRHVSVTLDPTGDYPFFTIPVSQLEEADVHAN